MLRNCMPHNSELCHDIHAKVSRLKQRGSLSLKDLAPQGWRLSTPPIEIKECLLDIINYVIQSEGEHEDDVYFEHTIVDDTVESNMDVFDFMETCELCADDNVTILATQIQECENRLVNLPKRGEKGNNTGARGFGSSERTLRRKEAAKRKLNDNAIDYSQNLGRFFTVLPRTRDESRVQSFARFCFRFMSGYRQGLSGQILDYTFYSIRDR